MEAKAFYAVICIATIVGMIMNFTPIDPIRALYWSAVINGVVAVPVMAIMMWLAAAPKVMGEFVITGWTKALGWIATAVMARGSRSHVRYVLSRSSSRGSNDCIHGPRVEERRDSPDRSDKPHHDRRKGACSPERGMAGAYYGCTWKAI